MKPASDWPRSFRGGQGPSNGLSGGRCCFFLHSRQMLTRAQTASGGKHLFKECHDHSVGLLKQIAGSLRPVARPLLECRQTLPPLRLVDTQAAVLWQERATRSRSPLANWRLGPPKCVGSHAARRHRLHELAAGEQGRFGRKPSRVLATETMPRLNRLLNVEPRASPAPHELPRMAEEHA